nr:Protein of unknown function DUF1758 domain containing protein [Haemonchus contortus]
MDYRTVTLLLDSRARRSFIKSSFGTSVKLPSLGTTSFTSVGMRGLQETSQPGEVRITLKSLRSAKKLKHVSVLTEDTLIAPTRTAKLSEVDRSFITKKKIPIAQRSLLPANVSPDILIGQDLLHRILDHNSAAIKLPSGLMLTPTIFGYTITGTSTTPSSMKQVRGAQYSSLIVSAPVISSKGDSKKGIHISEAKAIPANIGDPTPIRRSAAKVRSKKNSQILSKGTPRKKKRPIGKPKTTLRTPLVSQNDKDVFSNKDARDTFYALLNSVDEIKRKLNRMEGSLRRLHERMHTLDLRTQKVTQTEMCRPRPSQCPTVSTIRRCYMIGHQATDRQIRSAILQSSTGRIAQKPVNRLIPLDCTLHHTTKRMGLQHIEQKPLLQENRLHH